MSGPSIRPWTSLGLMRALPRRGLELGGWFPYFLALAEALSAAFIIALLAITMVVGGRKIVLKNYCIVGQKISL